LDNLNLTHQYLLHKNNKKVHPWGLPCRAAVNIKMKRCIDEFKQKIVTVSNNKEKLIAKRANIPKIQENSTCLQISSQ
jgi:hypothetical protein